jgi:hypothetical protein
MQSSLARIGAVAAVVGAVTLFAATFLHPMEADPNDAVAAFTEYAADPLWVTSHLGQFLGVLLLGAGLVALSAVMDPGAPSAWAQIGRMGTAVSVAATAALQAVDGVALKVAVDRWAAAEGAARTSAFEAAFAVRQVEIGLASLTGLTFGLTLVVFGVAMLLGRRFPRWLGWVALAGGLGTAGGGIAQAYTGFSSLAMTLGMPANAAVLVWAVGTGILLWRLAPSLPQGAGAVDDER